MKRFMRFCHHSIDRQYSLHITRLLEYYTSSSQVISSVTSAVKELVENAIDAHATSIDVRLENYGLDKIEVRDNGIGVKPTDINYVAKEHYTSKLQSIDDLTRLSTYGFRGEALASLCAVSDVFITTKHADVDIGSTFSFDINGNVVDSKPSHLPQGTTIIVRDLFKRFPVRRSFYSTSKKCRAELRSVEDCLVSFAVIKPKLRLTFRHNKDVVLTKVAAKNVEQALMAVIGSSIVASMQHVERVFVEPPFQVEAFLPKPGAAGLEASRSTNDRLLIFVNERPVVMPNVAKTHSPFWTAPVSSFLLSEYFPTSLRLLIETETLKVNVKLLRDFYCRTLLSVDRFPVAILHIIVPPGIVDVNLEPNKTRVLLHNQETIVTSLTDIFQEVYALPAHEIKEASVIATVSMETVDESELSIKLVDEAVKCAELDDRNSSNEFRSIDQSIESSNVNSIEDIGAFNTFFENDDLDLVANGMPLQSGSEHGQVLRPSCSVYNKTSCADVNVCNDEQFNHDELMDDITFNTEPVVMSDVIDCNQPDVMSGVAHCHRPGVIGDTSDHNQPFVLREAVDWSKGYAVRDSTGRPVEPVKLSTTGTGSRSLEGESSLVNSSPMTKQSTLPELLSSKVVTEALRREDQPMNTEKSFGSKRKNSVVPDLAEAKKFNKKCKVGSDQGIRSMCIDKLLASQSKGVTRLQSVVLPFSFQQLKQKVENKSTRSSMSLTSRLRVIGRLKSHGLWICLRENTEVTLFHLFRAQEQMMYLRMMSNHALFLEHLDTPIILDAKALCSANCYNVLLSMERSLATPTDPTCYIIDDRLIKNGFKIKEYIDATGRVSLQVVSMAKCIGYYGMLDLNEILTAILRSTECKLSDCRPIKVKHYFQAEASRLSRRLNSDVTLAEAEDILDELSELVPDSTAKCFHNRPIFVQLYKMDNSRRNTEANS